MKKLMVTTSLVCLLASTALAGGYSKSTFSGGYTQLSGDSTLWSGSLFSYDDDDKSVNIGFDFEFYGVEYSSCRVSTNGFITFGSNDADAYNNVSIPSTSGPNRYIALFWDDLIVKSGSASTDRISYKRSGSSPNRVLTIQYHSVTRLNNNGSYLYGQIKLYETSNRVELIYSTTNNWTGVTATIGIEDAAGTSGVGGPSNGSSQSSRPSVNYRFTPSLTTISGVVKYQSKTLTSSGYSGTTSSPARYITARLRDTTTDTVLATSYSGSNGSFTITKYGFSGRFRVEFEADSSACEVEDPGIVDTTYTGQTAQYTVTGSSKSLGTQTFSTSTPMAAALNMLDMCVDGYQYTDARTSESIPKVQVRWDSGTSNTYYSYITDDITIYDAHDHQWCDAAILHEYGHHAMSVISRLPTLGGSHSHFVPSSEKLAWAEGWASYFSCAVRDTSSYKLSRGTWVSNYDLETDDAGSSAGSSTEASIASILWDIRDGRNEDHDYYSGGDSAVFQTVDIEMDSSLTAFTIDDFLEAWDDRGYEPRDITSLFIDHGVHSDDSSEPNDERGTGSTPKGATTMPVSASLSGRKISKWNDDFYRIPVTESGVSLTVKTTFSHAQGNLDLQLLSSSGTVLRSGTTSTNNESVTLSSASSGTYYARVYGHQDAENPSYTISYSIPVSIVTTSIGQWTQGRSVSKQLVKRGGVGTVTWSRTGGSLPPGVSLSSSGALTGTPSSSGSYQFTVRAVDTPGTSSASRTYTWTINPPPAVVTSSLPSWTRSHAYTRSVSGTGGTAPYSWSVSSGSLPSGLGLSNGSSATALVSGTPSSSQTRTFTITMRDATGATASRAFTMTINPRVSISSSSLPDWTKGVNIARTMSASGGTGSITWSLESGSLPSGVSLSPTGVMSGTPGSSGSYTVTLRGTDSVGARGSRTLTWTVNAPPSVTTASLSDWTRSRPYSKGVTGAGGTTPISWSVASGSLPAGLALSGSGRTVTLSGTPSAAGTSTFTLRMTDTHGATATRSYAVTVNPLPQITTTSIGSWTKGHTGFDADLVRTGGTAPFTWRVASGSLPPGLALATGGSASGLTGTPTTTGSYSFTVEIADTAGATATQAYSMTINPPVTIATSSLPEWTQGVAISRTVSASGGTGALTWSLSAGSLPSGVSLSSSGGISGTPASSGSFPVTVRVVDSVGAAQTQPITWLVNAPPAITATSFPDWTITRPYSKVVNGTGGTLPITWTVTAGALPSGLSLSAADRAVTVAGTPTVAGTSSLTLRMTDAHGATTTQNLSLTMNPLPQITTTSVASWTKGHPGFDADLVRTGGTGPYAWRIASGALPPGLTLATAGSASELTGTPSAAGSYTFTVEVLDEAGATATRAYSTTINPPVTIATSSLPEWTQGVAFARTVGASGGTGALTWSLSAGSLPSGVSLSSSGDVSGTPAASGSFPITVRAVDTVGAAQTQSITWLVNAPPAIPASALPDWTITRPYSRVVDATGGTLPVTWSVVSGALPSGLTLSASDRAVTIAGTPDQVGSGAFTLRMQDAHGAAATVAFSPTINALPDVTTTSLPDWTESHAFSQDLDLGGGTAPFTWSVAAGALPTGLALSTDSSGARVVGTPTAPGSYSFTIKIEDTAGAADTQAYTLDVANRVTLSATSLAEWTEGIAFSHTLVTSGGTGGVSCALRSGSLPSGVSLATDGQLTGTPTQSGSYAIELEAVDAVGAAAVSQVSWTVNAYPTIDTTALADWTVGRGYSEDVAGAGGTLPVTWTVLTGGFPQGLSLAATERTATVSGTPSTAEERTVTLEMRDLRGAVATATFSVRINAVPTISTTSIPAWTADLPFDLDFARQDGTPPFSWRVSSGDIPSGLTLASTGDVGRLHGTPDTAGDATFTVELEDAAGATSARSYSVTINEAISVTTTDLDDWTQGIPFGESIAASGGTGSLAWTVSSGSLPPGVALSGDGRLSGTPSAPGDFGFVLQATDSVGATGTTSLQWRMHAAVKIVTGTLPSWTVGQVYSQSIVATGGTPPTTWEVDGATSLPAGLTFDATSGALTGTPTEPGDVSFTLRARDRHGSTDAVAYSLRFNATPSIAPHDALILALGRRSKRGLALDAGTGTPPFVWTVRDGELPRGLLLGDADGALIGFPGDAGGFRVTIQVRDASGATTEIAETVYVAEPLVAGSRTDVQLSRDDARRFWYFDAIADTKVKLTALFPDAAGNAPTLAIHDADGRGIDTGQAAKSRKREARLKGWKTPSSGRWFLGIDQGPTPYAGRARLSLRLKPRSSWKHSVPVPDGASEVRLSFAGLSGASASVQLKAKGQRKSPISITSVSVLDPFGNPVDLSDAMRANSASRVSLKKLRLPHGGDYVLVVAVDAEAAGRLSASVDVKLAKGQAFDVTD